MKIQLKSWKVYELTLSVNDNSDRSENTFDLESGAHFSNSHEDKEFRIFLNVSVKDKEFYLKLKSTFIFELTDSLITEEFKLSSFPKVNAPAIAFPYLRSFVSTVSLQAGFHPAILPSINFLNYHNTDGKEKTEP